MGVILLGKIKIYEIAKKLGLASKEVLEAAEKLNIEVNMIQLSHPGHISRQNFHSKRYMYPYVHYGTIHNSQGMETT